MSGVLRDCLFGIRVLRRSLGFAATASATLAVGIAATSTIFSVLYGTFFAPMPYRDAESVVAVWLRYDGERANAEPKDFLFWKRHATLFADMQAWTWRQVNLATASQPERIQIGPATPGFLSMLGYGEPLLLGRTFTAVDGVPGNERVAILSHRLWQERFASDENIVGRPIRVDGHPYTVVGVMRAGQSDKNLNRLWVPLALTTERQEWLLVAGRLKPGVTLEQATTQMAALDRARDDRDPNEQGRTITVEPLKQSFVADSTASALWLLFAGVTVLMLMACANVANLLVARGTVRRRELAIRSAIGASSRAVVQQLVAESMVLGVCGGLLGIGLTALLLRAFTFLVPADLLPTEADIALSVPVLAFSAVAAATCALICGLIPAWHLTRGDIYEPLRQDGRTTTPSSHRIRHVLAASQCALAVVLLSAGITIIGHLLSLGRADLGFRTEDVLTFSLPMNPGRLASADQVERFYVDLLARLQAVPQVRSVSVSAGVPARDMGLATQFTVVSDPSRRDRAAFNAATPAYFETLGIRLRQGRAFNDFDRRGSASVAIVNETFVRRHLAGLNPLEQSIDVATPDGGIETSKVVRCRIVGVAADTRNFGPKVRTIEEVLVPFAQQPWPQATVAVRAYGSPASLLPTAAAIVRESDPDVPIDAPRTISQVVKESLTSERFNATLFGSFGAIGLLLAAFGLYGLLAFAVAQRTREIGIRIVLGATRRQVLARMVRHGMTPAVVGASVGLVGALAVRRVLAATITGDQPSLSLVLAAVVLLLVTACAGCFLPARRAARLDPLVAMRE